MLIAAVVLVVGAVAWGGAGTLWHWLLAMHGKH